MYKSVYELNRDQLDELKSNYFWSEDFPGCVYPHWQTGELVPVLFPLDIPDNVIFDRFNGVSFVNDDFSCTAGMED